MKSSIWIMFLALSLVAGDTKTEIDLRVTHGSILSTKIILHSLNTVGQRINIQRYESDEETTNMELLLSGRNVFDPKYFNEIVRANGMVITAGSVKDKKWRIEIDASSIVWQVPAITSDEGAQMEKSAVPLWFIVNEVSALNIEAPYGGIWYPDIAVLDANMNVLSSQHSFQPQEQMSFSLPEGAMYLKVANSNGMKLLKEGMFIEQNSDGQ